MYALQKYIKKNFEGVDVEVVDYHCPQLTYISSYKSKVSKNILKTFLRIIHLKYKRSRFAEFKADCIGISEKSYSPDSIKDANQDYDLFIAGSDQVWNLKLSGNDMNYFLNFAEKKKRFSYAASIGQDAFPIEYADQIIKVLHDYQKISVREERAKELVENYCDISDVSVHLDPTLLFSGEEWKNVCQKAAPKEDNYILVYTIAYSKEVIEKAKEYAMKHNKKVLYVGQFSKEKGIKYISSPSVYTFLSLFRDADYVFTNSFHGTVFSTLFQKKFWVALDLEDGRNERIKNLLKLCGTTERVDLANIDEEIDWETVEKSLSIERKKTSEYMKEILKDGK